VTDCFLQKEGWPVCGWGDDIQMDIKEIVWEGMEHIYVAADCNHWQAVVVVMKAFSSKLANFL
jgi:hypothetical protein